MPYSIPLCTILTKWPILPDHNGGDPCRASPSKTGLRTSIASCSAIHQAISVFEPPNPPDVPQSQIRAPGCQILSPPARVLPVRVATVNDDIALRKQGTRAASESSTIFPAGTISPDCRGQPARKACQGVPRSNPPLRHRSLNGDPGSLIRIPGHNGYTPCKQSPYHISAILPNPINPIFIFAPSTRTVFLCS